MLGVGFIATAFLGNMLAERLRATEALAERRGVDLANLTQVNALIIQHMQIGVLVCDAGGNIRLSNQAAQKFLNGVARGPPSTQQAAGVDRRVSPDLAQLFRWLGDERGVRSPQRLYHQRNGYQVLPRFTALGAGVCDFRRCREQPPGTRTGALIFSRIWRC